MRRAVSISACLLACAACQEEKIVKYKPFFAGLEGASTQTPMVDDGSFKPTNPGAVADNRIVIENKDGTKTLVAKTAGHLMQHIQTTLREGDEALFTEQVLSQATRREFLQRGYDPAEAFKELKRREKEINKLFARMPMGEHTPTVFMEKIGDKSYRVRLTGQATRGLDWRGFDMIMEEGNWRLLWFYSG